MPDATVTPAHVAAAEEALGPCDGAIPCNEGRGDSCARYQKSHGGRHWQDCPRSYVSEVAQAISEAEERGWNRRAFAEGPALVALDADAEERGWRKGMECAVEIVDDADVVQSGRGYMRGDDGQDTLRSASAAIRGRLERGP